VMNQALTSCCRHCRSSSPKRPHGQHRVPARGRPGHSSGSGSGNHRHRRHDQGTCARAVVVVQVPVLSAGFCVLLPTRPPLSRPAELPMDDSALRPLVTLAGVPLPTPSRRVPTTIPRFPQDRLSSCRALTV
jgi:hypothetical protein